MFNVVVCLTKYWQIISAIASAIVDSKLTLCSCCPLENSMGMQMHRMTRRNEFGTLISAIITIYIRRRSHTTEQQRHKFWHIYLDSAIDFVEHVCRDGDVLKTTDTWYVDVLLPTPGQTKTTSKMFYRFLLFRLVHVANSRINIDIKMISVEPIWWRAVWLTHFASQSWTIRDTQ